MMAAHRGFANFVRKFRGCVVRYRLQNGEGERIARRPGVASTVWFVAFVGVSLLFVRQLLERLPDAAPQAQASAVKADDHYLCQPKEAGKVIEGSRALPLIVKYSGGVATEILFEFTHSDRADAYQIKEHDDVYYRADESSPDAPEAFVSLKINRLSGDVEATTRLPTQAVQLLADVCDGRLSMTECKEREKKINPEKLLSECGMFAKPDYCPRWQRSEEHTSELQS